MNRVSKIKPVLLLSLKEQCPHFQLSPTPPTPPISQLVALIPRAGRGAWGLQVGMRTESRLGGWGTLGWGTPEEGGEEPQVGFAG